MPSLDEIQKIRATLLDLGAAMKAKRELLAPLEPTPHKKKLGIGMREAAILLNIPVGYYGMIEAGLFCPTDDVFLAIDAWLYPDPWPAEYARRHQPGWPNESAAATGGAGEQSAERTEAD